MAGMSQKDSMASCRHTLTTSAYSPEPSACHLLFGRAAVHDTDDGIADLLLQLDSERLVALVISDIVRNAAERRAHAARAGRVRAVKR